MEDKFFSPDMFGGNGDSPEDDKLSFSAMFSAVNADESDTAGEQKPSVSSPDLTEGEAAGASRNGASDTAVPTGAPSEAGYGADSEYPDRPSDGIAEGYSGGTDEGYSGGTGEGYSGEEAGYTAVMTADKPRTEAGGAVATVTDDTAADSAAPRIVPLSALNEDAERLASGGRRSKNKNSRRASAKECKKKLTAGCVVRRILASLLAAVIIAVYLVLTVIFVLVKGPSPSAKRLFVLSVKETSAAGFLADIFLPSDEVEAILAAQEQSASGNGETTDATLINIDKNTGDGDQDQKTDIPASAEPEEPGDGIEIIEVKKESFNGVIMKIDDPKRVFLGIPDAYGETAVGLTLRQMAAKYGAIGGINAGGFYDPNGSGRGGIPDGLVINDGKLIWGSATTAYNVIGFDGDGILHVGSMTGNTALSLGIKYACCFGPTLVVNGVACNSRGSLGGGMNPRTAIGQTSDGSVLFVVINGRSLGSLGATYDDLTDLLIEYGAVNGANLDGGSSSLLLYNGEFLNVSASVIGERELPTSFLVK